MKLRATSQFTLEELKKAELCILENFGFATGLDLDEPISQAAIEEVHRQNNLVKVHWDQKPLMKTDEIKTPKRRTQ